MRVGVMPGEHEVGDQDDAATSVKLQSLLANL